MAVAFDAVGPSSAGTASATSPLTWTHVNSGNAILVGVTIFNGSTNTVTAVTYGGVALALQGFVQGGTGGGGGVALYGLAGGTVPTGSNTVSVSFSDGANHNAGSISLTGAVSLGTPVTNSSNATSVTANVAGTAVGGMIVAACSYGGNSLITITGTNSVTTQWFKATSPNSGSDNGAGGTVASAGGTQTVGFSDTGTDFWGIVAVEVTGSGGTPVQGPRPQRGGKRYRSHFGHRQTPQPTILAPAVVTANAGVATVSAAASPVPFPTYITGIASPTGASYFTDNHGSPRMWAGDEIWALLTNAGRWNSGNYQATFDAYFATRAAQGYTVCYSDMFNSTFIGGAANGQMWNGQTPFTSGNPSSGLNNTYWQVIDYALNSAAANGITVALSFGGHWDWDVSGNAMFGFTGTQYQAAGNAIGTRYKNQQNLIWLIMDDYFGSFDSSLSSLLTGLRASGDTHPIAIENYAETSSRFDLSTNGSLSWGASNTQYNFGYSYSESYLCVEYMFGESSPLTPIYGDGYFYQGGSTYAGGSGAGALDRAVRQEAWWAVTSGARGWNLGDEALWQWASTAPAMVPTQWFAANNLGNIRTFMESLPGWQTLAPDTSSVLVTAGRGTRGTQLSSGGGGGQYEPATSNSFVSASRTPDSGSGSSLAVMYLPNSTTITIDQTKIASGYTAYWVDPVTGVKTSTTTGSTYNSTAKGNNSQGDPDWVLLLQGPASASPAAGVAAVSVVANAPSTAVTVTAGVAAVTAAAPAPLASPAVRPAVSAVSVVALAPSAADTATAAAAAVSTVANAPQAAITATAGVAVIGTAGNAATGQSSSGTNANAAVAAVSVAANAPGVADTATAGAAAASVAAPAATTALTATAGVAVALAAAPAPSLAETVTAAAAAASAASLAPSVADTATAGAAIVSAAAPAAAGSSSSGTNANAGVAAVGAAAPAPSGVITARAAVPAATATALQAAASPSMPAAGAAAVSATARAPAIAAAAQAQAARTLAAALAATGAAVEPFTVGTLTASDRLAAVLASAAATTPVSTLTATDTRTGGPT